MPRRRSRGGGVPRARPQRVRRRRPVPPGRADRRRRGRARVDRRGEPRPAPGDRGRRAAAPRQPSLQLRGRDPRGHRPRRLPEVLPADLSRVLRAALVRPGRRPGRWADHDRRRRGALRARPHLHRHRPARPQAPRRGLRGHVGADPAERAGRAGRCLGARQPVRQPDHDRARRGPAAAGAQRERAVPSGLRLCGGRPGGVDDRPQLGRPDDDLRVRGAARRGRPVPLRGGARDRRHRPRPDPPGTVAAGDLRRQRPRRGRRRLPNGRVRARPADR